MIADTESDIGSSWLATATSPIVASTALSPSRSGIPAATTAPKATSRMISVTGTENSPAFFRSSVNVANSAFSVLSPNEPTKKSGCAFCTSATRATTGSILSTASSEGPRISIRTSAECLSAEMNPLFPGSYGDFTFATASSSETPVMTAWTAALKAGSLAVSERLWIRTSSPAGCLKSSYRIVSARPDSPGPDVSKTIFFIGETRLIANKATAKASQPKIAFLRCCALQRAMRAARFPEDCGGVISMLLSDLRLQMGGWSWNVDLADARCRRAFRDVEGEQRDRVPLGCGFDGPPDRVPAKEAR